MLPNVIAIANGKGGVGKTTLTANIAGVLASQGWDVLAVDLDPQGNLQNDLGYKTADKNDQGQALVSALVERDALTPSLQGIRPGLDIVCGGSHLGGLLNPAVTPGTLTAALTPIASRYHCILLDCPTSPPITRLALETARGVVIPVRADASSVEGLEVLSALFADVKATTNPQLAALGVVCFGIPTRATALRTQLRTRLDQALGGVVPVLQHMIRDSSRAAWEARDWGELAHEYANSAQTARTERIAALSKNKRPPSSRRYSTAAAELARDYLKVTAEIIQRLQEIQ